MSRSLRPPNPLGHVQCAIGAAANCVDAERNPNPGAPDMRYLPPSGVRLPGNRPAADPAVAVARGTMPVRLLVTTRRARYSAVRIALAARVTSTGSIKRRVVSGLCIFAENPAISWRTSPRLLRP
jgi:hypothetical protein